MRSGLKIAALFGTGRQKILKPTVHEVMDFFENTTHSQNGMGIKSRFGHRGMTHMDHGLRYCYVS